MRFIRQHEKLPVRNNDFTDTSNYCKHSQLLPNNLRALFIGPSNCGKTNTLITLVEDINGVKFEAVYVYSKSLYQPKYKYLENLLRNIENIEYHTFSENNQVIPLSEAKENSMFVFDDIASEKQNHLRDYFCMGRHKMIDTFCLAQTYAHIPKHLIRDNVNFLVIFKQDNLNLKHIYEDHVNTDMSFQQFHNICRECWKDDYGFLCVNKECRIDNGRYRKGFDTFILL